MVTAEQNGASLLLVSHTPLDNQAPDNIGFLGLVLVKACVLRKVFRLMRVLSSGLVGFVKRTKGSSTAKHLKARAAADSCIYASGYMSRTRATTAYYL